MCVVVVAVVVVVIAAVVVIVIDGLISEPHTPLLKLCEMVFLSEMNNMCQVVGVVYRVVSSIIHMRKS